MGLFSKIFKSILKASRPSFVFESHQLKFDVSEEEYLTYDISDYEVKTRHDPYVVEAYTLANNELFIEYIKTDSDTTWNGQSRSLFETFFKDELKINSLSILKREEFGHYEMTTYRVNDNFILHLIFIWDATTDIFIIDTKGELFKTLMSKLQKDYEYPYESEEKGSINFNISMVKENAFKNFFGTYN